MSRGQFQQQAEALFAALQSGDDAAAWRFKWEHPRFRGKHVSEVREASLTLDDARTVIAREESLDTWDDLVAFDENAPFERAVDALVSGDVETLRAMLRERPELVRDRSARRHRCTLLHYLGANGVEGWRQRTPANAVEVAKLLLDAGAEADALADLYDSKCTTMSMVVSSSHPAEAGLQIALAETLLDYGAVFGDAVETALAFGYLDTAQALARRGAPVSFMATAGLGRAEDVARTLPEADAKQRQIALALAAQLGQVSVVELLLDAGEDPKRYNPEGYHSHTTPLHQAVAANHLDVVRLLAARGARLDLRDTLYDGTPLDWAVYLKRDEIAEFLRSP